MLELSESYVKQATALTISGRSPSIQPSDSDILCHLLRGVVPQLCAASTSLNLELYSRWQSSLLVKVDLKARVSDARSDRPGAGPCTQLSDSSC